jgi:glycosyltransferase involved in cell wall biosynthesis
MRRAAVRLLALPVDVEVAVTEHVRRGGPLAHVLPPSRVRRIYNGVDVRRVPPPETGTGFRTRFGIPESATVVLQVSALISEKGCEDLVEALGVARRTDPSLHVVFAGEGPHREAIHALAERLGLQDHVTFTSMSADPFGEGVFAAADIVCQPSRWQEAFGWSIAEGMAHSKPIVATEVGGIPEIVEDGITGYLVPRCDVPALAVRLLQLAADPPLRQRMGAAGAETVRRRFDMRERVADLLEIYGLPARRAEACPAAVHVNALP